MRNCYVCVSELAKSHSKPQSRKALVQKATAGVAAVLTTTLLLTGASGSVFAADPHDVSINSTDSANDTNYNNGGATGKDAVAIGVNASAGADNDIVIGKGATVASSTQKYYKITDQQWAKVPTEFLTTTEQLYTHVRADGSVIVNTTSTFQEGDKEGSAPAAAEVKDINLNNSDAISIGTNASAEGESGIAIGKDASTHVDPTYSDANGSQGDVHGRGNAIGDKATARGEYAIALGSSDEYVATEYTEAKGFKSIAIGVNAKTGNNSDYAMAIGAGANAKNTGAIAIGNTAKSIDTDNVAVGTRSVAQGNGAISMGRDSQAIAAGSIAIGVTAATKDGQNDSIAIGTKAKANGFKSIALGNNAEATGFAGVSINENADASGRYAVAFGYEKTDTTTNQMHNVASGPNSFAHGEHAQAKGNDSTAFGKDTIVETEAKYGTAFGEYTTVTGARGTAFGEHTTATGMDSTAFGNYSQATNTGATAFGNKNIASGLYATAWGGGDKETQNADGTTTKVGTEASGTYATAFGERTVASGESATAFGADSKAAGKNSVAFGESSDAEAENSLAALGGVVEKDAANSAAIGKGAKATVSDTVALGSGSVADRAKGMAGINPVTGKASTETTTTWVANANAIAVGNGTTTTRQITGVAAGTNDTDAVNVAQLRASVTHDYSVNSSTPSTDTNYYNQGATGTNALAAGVSAKADSENSIAIGTNAGIKGDKHLYYKVDNGTWTAMPTADEYQDGTKTYYRHNILDANGNIIRTVINASANLLEGEKEGTTLTLSTANNNLKFFTVTNKNSIAMGTNAVSEGETGIAIGTGAVSKVGIKPTEEVGAGGGMAIGNQASAYDGSVVVGDRSGTRDSSDTYSTVVGSHSYSNGAQASVFGYNSHAADNAVAVGSNTQAWGKNSTAIGGATASDTGAIAIGNGASATEEGGVALGQNAVTDTPKGRTGYGAPSWQKDSAVWTATDAAVSVGSSTGYELDTDGNIVRDEDGNPVVATADKVVTRQIANVAAGTNDTDAVNVAQLNAVKAHYYSVQSTKDDVMDKQSNYNNDGATGEHALAAGVYAAASGKEAITAGFESNANHNYASVYGSEASALGEGATAVGYQARASERSTVIGAGSHAGEDYKYSTIVGVGSYTQGSNAVIVGYNSHAGENSIAIGNGTNAWVGDSIAIGNGSLTAWREKNARKGYGAPSTIKDADQATWTATNGAVSVGRAAGISDGKGGTLSQITRQINNVAAGTLDTDAVNVAQLKATETHYYSVKGASTKTIYNADGTVKEVLPASDGNDNTNYTNDGATAEGAIAAGPRAQATGAASIAIGLDAKAWQANNIGIGNEANSWGTNATAVGAGTGAGNNAAAFGYKANAYGTNGTAVGEESSAAENSSALGKGANAWGINGTAVGEESGAAENSSALGKGANAWGINGTAVGLGANAGMNKNGKGYNTAVGSNASAEKDYGTAVGANAHVSGDYAVAIGEAAAQDYSVAIGYKATSYKNSDNGYGTAVGTLSSAGDYATSLGYGVTANGTKATGIGKSANASGEETTAVGTTSSAFSKYSVAVGANSVAGSGGGQGSSGEGQTAVGHKANATGTYSVAVGYDANTNGNNGVAIGQSANTSAWKGVAIGYKANASGSAVDKDGNPADVNSLAIGNEATASTKNSIALGYNAKASGEDTIAFGREAGVSGIGSIGIGSQANVSGKNTVAIGQNTNGYGDNAVIVGTGSAANTSSVVVGDAARADIKDSIVLGSGSRSAANKNVTGYDPAGAAHETTDAAWTSTNAAVSVGRAAGFRDTAGNLLPQITRQISNVAAGTLDTDAVNVAQLKQLGTAVTSAHTKVTVEGGTEAASGENAYNGKNLKLHVSTDTKGANVYDLKLGDNLNVGAKDGADGTPGTDGSIGVNGKDGSAVTINGKDGSIGLNGANGANGLTIKGADGKPGVDGADGTTTTRIVYETKDGETVVKHQVATMDDGLKFGANAAAAEGKNPVANKLNSTVKIVGSTAKEGHEYTADNLTTTVSQDADGNTTINILMDKDITSDSVTAGKNGKDGVNGHIGVRGKDGTDGKNGKDAVAIDGKDGNEGHIGLKGNDGEKGAAGADGSDGKNAYSDISVHYGPATLNPDKNVKDAAGNEVATRIHYTDQDGKNHEVATMDDGLIFVGDDGKVVKKYLNEQLTIKGGESDANKLSTGKNIGVVNDDGALKIELAKEITDINKITFNSTTDSSKHVVISGDEVNVGGNKITNVAAGVNDNDAVNVSQLNKKIEAVEAHHTDVTVNGGTEAPTDGTYTTDGNLKLKVTKDAATGKKTYDVKLSEDLNVKSVTTTDENGNTTVQNGSGVTSTDKDGNTTTLKGDGVTTTDKSGNSNSMTSTANTLSGKDADGNTITNTVTKDGMTITNSGDAGKTISITNNNISMGGQQVHNVTAGTADTDAVNVSQLKDEISKVEQHHTKVTVEGGTAAGTTDYAGENLKLKETTDANGAKTYDLKLGDNINIGGKDGKDGSIGVKGKDGKDGVTVDGKDGGSITFAGKDGKDGKPGTDGLTMRSEKGAAGLDGKDGITRIVYKDADGTDHTVATHDDGLKFVGDDGKTISKKLNETLAIKGGESDTSKLSTGKNIGVVNDNGALKIELAKDITGVNSITFNSTTDNSKHVTIGGDKVDVGGNKITNVADGRVAPDSKDAVNGSQLYQTNQAIANMDGSINKLDSRLDRVGAGAAALAGLHPLDFDPDDKLEFAAGYGNYRSANAVAVGAFYHPNEDTMVSVSGSTGGGENMVNAGLTMRFGQNNHVSRSRVAMGKEILDLRLQVEELKGVINRMAGSNVTRVQTEKLFPDIAKNHWAYEAVMDLSKRGLVEGYPDGTFGGDHLLTRYEFAMIVYRAIQSGADVAERLFTEFEPELSRIRVDALAHDKNGKPTIERVRVNKDYPEHRNVVSKEK